MTNLPERGHAQKCEKAFSLVEVLLCIVILVLLTVIVAGMVNSASVIATAGHKIDDQSKRPYFNLIRLFPETPVFVGKHKLAGFAK